ncbi:MAG: hypothetical protein IJ411_05835 [Oscillospiraceae bacterium]|nr:hypothetical protein [Oscillospiraceae bacterium]
MEFKKKLKIRFYTAISYILIGLAMMAVGLWKGTEVASSFGLMFLIMGIARIRQYRRITATEESIRKQEIAETDERNIMLWNKAKSLTVNIYIYCVGITVIVLYFLNQKELATILSYNMLFLVAIYWICYAVLRKKY